MSGCRDVSCNRRRRGYLFVQRYDEQRRKEEDGEALHQRSAPVHPDRRSQGEGGCPTEPRAVIGDGGTEAVVTRSDFVRVVVGRKYAFLLLLLLLSVDTGASGDHWEKEIPLSFFTQRLDPVTRAYFCTVPRLSLAVSLYVFLWGGQTVSFIPARPVETVYSLFGCWAMCARRCRDGALRSSWC